MNHPDTSPSSRRELRAQAGAAVMREPSPEFGTARDADAPAPAEASEAAELPATAPLPVVPEDATSILAIPPLATTSVPPKSKQLPARVAFGWVDERTLTLTRESDLRTMTSPLVPVEPDLLSRPPRRSPLRPGVLVPIATFGLIIGSYAATTLLWPLTAVAPAVQAIQVDSIPAPAAAPAWPTVGSGAVSVAGIEGVVASTPDVDSIASITKVVTALMVLDANPLAVGEQGPEYRFTAADRVTYHRYLARGESALDVPVGGALTEYQMLEGMLIGSASNYADRIAGDLWPTNAVFASAANGWLTAHGVPGIKVVEPTGFDARNTASPAALIALAQKALANPVIAEIVAKTSTDLPGAGHVTNTNGLLADPGVIGVKTGSLKRFNLLAAKNIAVGQTKVQLYADALGQPDDKGRVEATRALFTQLEAELQLRPSVTKGTTVGIVDTLWGDKVKVVTDADAEVVLWNSGAGTVSTAFDLGDKRDKRDVVGALTVRGPLDSSTVDVQLAGDIEPPTGWWRLTHPLDLFGLNG